jgi:hypothetical protein
MSKVYLVNVGANRGHAAIARCPIFKDDTFIFVPFPHPGEHGSRVCPKRAQPFLRGVDPRDVHDDPDWDALTYGDNCANPRALALTRVQPKDILLFWALLWRNRGGDWSGFSGEHGWYLIGALRVTEILDSGQRADDASPANRTRAARSVHVEPGEPLPPKNRVFIGSRRHSKLFPRAVDFQVTQGSGLIYRTIRTAKGHRLNRLGKRSWFTSTRACRAIWNLNDAEERKRADIAATAVKDYTGYDLLDQLS